MVTDVYVLDSFYVYQLYKEVYVLYYYSTLQLPYVGIRSKQKKSTVCLFKHYNWQMNFLINIIEQHNYISWLTFIILWRTHFVNGF